jgi:NitT/TauT family transport system substrate-binding protein
MSAHVSSKILSLCLLLMLAIAAACTPVSIAPPPLPQAPGGQPQGGNKPAATAVATAVATAPATAPATLTKIKVSILPFQSYAPIFIAIEEGYFAEQGLEIETLRIDKTSEAMPALAQGQIDVASGFFDVSTLNAIDQGGRIKYVSDKGYLGAAETCNSTSFVVRKGLVEMLNADLKNLKGMKIAVTPTSAAEYALFLLLKQAGLTIQDVEILNIPLPARLEGMNNGSVDIAGVSDPWTLRMVAAGHSDWKGWQTLMPNFQFSVNMYGPNMLDKNRDLGVKYMIAYLKGARQYAEGKTPRNIEIIQKYTQMPAAEIQGSCFMSIRPDGMANINDPSLQAFQEWAIAAGYQNNVVTPDKLWDLSFVQAALEALK